MVWAKFDDRFSERIELQEISLEARWHYIALVLTCCRTEVWDGVLKVSHARRLSDVPDPDRALLELAEHDLVKIDGNRVKVVDVAEFVPAPHIRENAEHSKIRMQRLRAHKAGDHSLCLPESCEAAPPENHALCSPKQCKLSPSEGDTPVTLRDTLRVTPGRDGTGRDGPISSEALETDLADVTALPLAPEPDPEPQREVWGAVNYPKAMDGLPADSWDR
ncbi:hypothetical protein SAMN06298212_10571 [Ruaniaceae bacterium KH17]|nr:hypothetical protein SAMN06298212_10571 [Ruaniaceae bacterium KH17]